MTVHIDKGVQVAFGILAEGGVFTREFDGYQYGSEVWAYRMRDAQGRKVAGISLGAFRVLRARGMLAETSRPWNLDNGEGYARVWGLP